MYFKLPLTIGGKCMYLKCTEPKSLTHRTKLSLWPRWRLRQEDEVWSCLTWVFNANRILVPEGFSAKDNTQPSTLVIKGLVFQKEMNFCPMCSFGNSFKRSRIVSLDVQDCCLVSLWWVVLWHSELNTQHKKYVLIIVSCSELLVFPNCLLLQAHLNENKLAKKTHPPFTKLAKKTR